MAIQIPRKEILLVYGISEIKV